MTSGIREEKKDIIQHLAETFIRGRGIETGHAPCRFPVPPGVCLRRVDESALAEGEGKTGIPPANLDFCIATHLVQNAGDPLTFLQRCLQTLRPGGMVFFLVPCTSDSVVHLPAVKRALLSHVRDSSADGADAAGQKKEKNLMLPVRIPWQGEGILAGSRTDIFVLERFDYVRQIVDLLQKKRASPATLPCRVDVIIPVYNAYDDLLRCLYSVMIHHEHERVILLDDHSTDPRVGSLFSVLEPCRSSWFVLVRQEKNRGFAATVNRGICYSQNDVLLLNSDTIVTKGWVKKLEDAAGSLENCGTLTPLTNNGTLCSVPVMMENNLLFYGASIDGYADMVEKISFARYPRIPTGIGFCLYITRRCLDTTGSFDDVTFGEGYGEESDFCLRAGMAGMTHHVCDTTFIYHRGMASFSARAMRRLQEGIAALNARYPTYQDEVSRFIRDNPLREIQENIACRAATWDFSGSLPRVLCMPGSERRDSIDRQTGGFGDRGMSYILRYTPEKVFLSEYNHGNHLEYTFPADTRSPEAIPEIIGKILCSFWISSVCMDHPDTRVSSIAGQFHIPCSISTSSPPTAPDTARGPARKHGAMPGVLCDSGVPGEEGGRSPLRERQVPGRGSGKRFTPAEIFHSISAFPEPLFREVLPFRPEPSGPLPARFFRCLSENGVLYTLHRTGFFIKHRNDIDR